MSKFIVGRNEVFLYPTEGIWGLGGNAYSKDVFDQIVALKGRAPDKPVLCVYDDWSRVKDWVDLSGLIREDLDFYTEHQNKFITFVLPASSAAPKHCTKDATIALRLTSHPVVTQLCMQLNAPLLSTSANKAGEAPGNTIQELIITFPGIKIIEGDLGGQGKPSGIFNMLTRKWDRLP